MLCGDAWHGGDRLYCRGHADSPAEQREKIREINDRAYIFNGDTYPLVIMACKCYEETLRVIKELSPTLILPGSDPGLELSLRLSSDLGLKSNPLSVYLNLRDKFVMQEILRLSGMRYIRSRAVNSEEEAISFFKEEQGKKAVIKPTQAAGSVNVFICGSEDEVRKAYRINHAFVKKRDRGGKRRSSFRNTLMAGNTL